MEVVSGGETLCLTVLSGGHTLSHLFSLSVCVCVCVCVCVLLHFSIIDL